MRNLTTIISKETCLFYGLPGTAILAVSLILSCKVGNDFAGSTFVNTVSFFGSNVLLWLLYLVLFQYLPVDLMRIWLSRKNLVSIKATKNNADIGTVATPVSIVHPMTAEEYKAHCAEFERKKQEEHQKLVKPIIDYVGRVMSPFMEEAELDLLRNEIQAWCDNPNHKPKPVKLKTVHDYKDKLKTVSFKHFIWNIAARLGFGNGYSGKIQADFIKSLFPNELKDVESKSLERSLTNSPDDGHIKLDRPKHTDNYIFHF
ncbi:MAG: hypothetical protein IJY03_02420 [Prevotella sp.]|nr:hypothetical protein [Prevotella sp.]